MKQYPKSVCSLIINDNGLILSVSRKDDHSVFGLPGGKVEETDKSLEHAAWRELFEETGVDAKGGIPAFTAICYGSDDRHYLTTTFIWQKILTPPKQTEEEGIVAWVSPDIMCRENSGKHKNFGIYNRKLFEALNIYVPSKESSYYEMGQAKYLRENYKNNRIHNV